MTIKELKLENKELLNENSSLEEEIERLKILKDKNEYKVNFVLQTKDQEKEINLDEIKITDVQINGEDKTGVINFKTVK